MKLNKVKVMWASLHRVNVESGKYQLDAINLSEADVKMLEAEGVEVRDAKIPSKTPEATEAHKTRGRWITLKSNYALKPECLVGPDKKPLEEGTEVGNESICNVICNAYDWKYNKKKGTSAGLQAVQVLKLVPFEAAGVSELEALDSEMEVTSPAPSEESAGDSIPF